MLMALEIYWHNLEMAMDVTSTFVSQTWSYTKNEEILL